MAGWAGPVLHLSCAMGRQGRWWVGLIEAVTYFWRRDLRGRARAAELPAPVPRGGRPAALFADGAREGAI